MTNQLENQSDPITLEGTIELPVQRQRTFRSLSALQDYCEVFNIDSYQCMSGIMYGTNEKIFQLTYHDFNQGE